MPWHLKWQGRWVMLKDLHAGRGRWFDLMNLGRTSNNNQWLNNPPVRSSGVFFPFCASPYFLLSTIKHRFVSLKRIYLQLYLKNKYRKILIRRHALRIYHRILVCFCSINRDINLWFSKMMPLFVPSKSALGYLSSFEKCKNRNAWRLSAAFPLFLLEDSAIIAL